MLTIFVENLVVSGAHGVLSDEKKKPQAFRIDIEVLVGRTSPRDDIGETVDYRDLKRAAESVMASRSRELLETLASHIAALVYGMKNVRRVAVTVRKLHIWKNAVPGVTVILPDGL